MPSKTGIEYGDYVSNPIRFALKTSNGRRAGRVGQACVKVGPECVHCWAEGMNKRFWTGLGFSRENLSKVEPFLDEVEMGRLSSSQAISGKRVLIEFCSDLFGEWVRHEWLEELFELFERRPDVTWVLLTKRTDRMHSFWWNERPGKTRPPLSNVWLGGTIGTQKSAILRMPFLTALGLAGWHVWISGEPLLEYVDLFAATPPDEEAWDEVNADPDDGEPEEFITEAEAECDWVNCSDRELVDNPEHRDWERSRRIRAGFLTFRRAIHLVAVGGESGPGARPTDPENVRGLRDQCSQAEVGFYFKQWGEWAPIPGPSPISKSGNRGRENDERNYPMHVFKHPGRQDEMVFQFGKKLAGHELDGVVWRSWPDE